MSTEKRVEQRIAERARHVVLCVLLTGVVVACGRSDALGGRASAAPVESIGVATQMTGQGDSVAGRPARGARRRVVILGTSLTAGLGLDPDKAYPAVLQRKVDSAGLSVTVVNAGLSGETSAGAVRRAAWVLDQPAAVVVLEVGANDGLRGVDPDSTRANLVTLIRSVQAQQPNAAVLLVQMEAPTNLGRPYTRRFHEAYGAAAKATGVLVLPFLLDGVAGVARLNQADGIHPNPEGAVRVADTMWRALLPTLRAIGG